MKSTIKKSLLILFALVSIIDWPVPSNAQMGKTVVRALAKGVESDGKGLFKSCSNTTQTVEENVNKATKSMGEIEVPRSAAAAATVNAVSHAKANAGGTNNDGVNYGSQRIWQTCNLCEGAKYIEVVCEKCDDGIVYCKYCDGEGCDFCNYRGAKYCPSCGGSGAAVEKCNWCNGKGGYYK